MIPILDVGYATMYAPKNDDVIDKPRVCNRACCPCFRDWRIGWCADEIGAHLSSKDIDKNWNCRGIELPAFNAVYERRRARWRDLCDAVISASDRVPVIFVYIILWSPNSRPMYRWCIIIPLCVQNSGLARQFVCSLYSYGYGQLRSQVVLVSLYYSFQRQFSTTADEHKNEM